MIILIGEKGQCSCTNVNKQYRGSLGLMGILAASQRWRLYNLTTQHAACWIIKPRVFFPCISSHRGAVGAVPERNLAHRGYSRTLKACDKEQQVVSHHFHNYTQGSPSFYHLWKEELAALGRKWKLSVGLEYVSLLFVFNSWWMK